ncbi:hypothetical protein [Carnimonas bestiolae]|uniref:hypothetical protein n=1 Tax=Carnimonas bestiolae TaxID=3402172 RepID=UPI003EDB79D6
MTKPVKFPSTDVIAHNAIVTYYSGKYPDGTHRFDWVKHDPNIGSGYGVVYLRADTATPNEKVEQMLLDAMGIVLNEYRDMDEIVQDVMSRYAPDSNNVRER